MSPHMPTSGKEAQKPQDWNFLQSAPTPQDVTYPPKATPPPPSVQVPVFSNIALD